MPIPPHQRDPQDGDRIVRCLCGSRVISYTRGSEHPDIAVLLRYLEVSLALFFAGSRISSFGCVDVLFEQTCWIASWFSFAASPLAAPSAASVPARHGWRGQ